MPSPKNTIDAHPKRAEIRRAIMRGKASSAKIAAEFGVSESAIDRYRDRYNAHAERVIAHASMAPPKFEVAADATPRQRAEAMAEWSRARLEYESAKPDASVKELSALAAQCTSAVRMLARLDGSLDVSEAHILRSPAMQRVQAVYDVALTYEGALTAKAVRERIEAEFARLNGE